MRQILDVLPGALLPDPIAESESPGAPLSPPDDDDLLRPAIEEELFRVGAGGTLVGAQTTTLAKHLVWSFGPVHRALPFPILLRVELDGDRLVTVDPEIGFLHQGLEKAGEGASWGDGFEVLSRMSPLSPLGHELAWALVVERLCDIEMQVPARAQLWRTIALELSRIAEHLRVLAAPALALSPRRNLVDAARNARGLVDGLAAGDAFRAIGGLRRAIHSDEGKRIGGELRHLIAGVREVKAAVDKDPGLDAHLEGLGRLGRFAALSLGVTGPALRACGVADDVRIHEPSFAGRDITPAVVFVDGGDARARARVRLNETIAAADVVERALQRLSQAPPDVAMAPGAVPDAPPAGRASASLELPNGELNVVVVSDGGPRPVRVRMRGASSALAAALPEILVGDRIDDVIPVLSGLDIIGTELDR
jgi:NADH:ubiquinone oxidoreductase subunit D